MLERLNSEKQLSNYAGWFIPLKIETAGKEWGQWNKKYSHDGSGIPIVFVIRADGEKLYGKSGSLPGNQLYQLLDSSLNNAGLQLSEKQLMSVEQVVGKAESSIEAGEPLMAVKELMRLSKIGVPGQIASHADIVGDANDIANELIKEATTILEGAETKIADKATCFEGLNLATECGETYGRLPVINKQMKTMRSAWNRDNEIKGMLKQVKQYRKLVKQTSKGKLNKKLVAIRDFHGKHKSDENMADRAMELLDKVVKAELSSESKSESVIDWVAKSGDKISGKLSVQLSGSKVQIETEKGGSKSVQLEDLDHVSAAIVELIHGASEG